MADGATLARPIKPRSVNLDYEQVPRHWLGGSVVGTHIANGVNLLFPAGERFFVRSVRRYMDRVDDPGLLEQIRGFFGQEGRHAKEHERFFRVLESQGYDLDRFLALYERIAFGVIERIAPPELALATTAACEHFTAVMAENALRSRFLDDVAAPTMRQLLLWHASEEIEHRAVAFDVLKRVNDSYGLRVAGMAVAASCLASFWLMGTVSLLLQEDAGPGELLADWRKTRKSRSERGMRPVFSSGIRDYLRRDFHPLDHDLDSLAKRYLDEAGIA